MQCCCSSVNTCTDTITPLFIHLRICLFVCAINGEIREKIVTFVNLGHNCPRVVGRLELSKDQNPVVGVIALHRTTETFSWQR